MSNFSETGIFHIDEQTAHTVKGNRVIVEGDQSKIRNGRSESTPVGAIRIANQEIPVNRAVITTYAPGIFEAGRFNGGLKAIDRKTVFTSVNNAEIPAINR